MGDTAIAPMYETLAKRGVRVEFFQQVTNLGVDRARKLVDRIDIVRQARLLGEYDPLCSVEIQSQEHSKRMGQLRCWPSVPKWDKLVNGSSLRDSGIDFERGEAEPNAERRSLHLGADFDTVVLAISPAALAPICAEVMEVSPAVARMLENTHTIMTQAFQISMNTDPKDLGFDHGHAAMSTFVEPLDTGADNSQVLWTENWPDGLSPKAVWYFCGVLDDADGDTTDEVIDRAKRNALDYLAHIGDQWPGAVGLDGFRWEILVDPENDVGEARFDRQYWRANSTATERYVQSLPGTVKHRLAVDESGIDNLFLAGDWTKNGFNLGAVEATVMSGMQASRAISGHPERIPWESYPWMT
jgi:uncharacterized protein with NAD-binding domain and iron-sulfur cluster